MAAAPKDAEAKARPIYIKRVKKIAAGHHGGAWKVAYADFVTAMMAFFLVMWLVTAVSKEQRAAIFDYFKNPSMEPGKSVKPAPGQMGPGGASTSPINLRGGLDSPKSSLQKTDKIGATIMTTPAPPIDLKTDAEKAAEVEEMRKLLEKKQLDALMQDLKEAIAKSQALKPFKDQLLLDITPEGLRIQILDAQNRPMFDLGSSRLKPYTNQILREVTGYLKTVPNRLSITGHTDATPYAGVTGFTNWDLSTDRANAARRALEGAGLDTARISRVVGLGSSVLFNKENPRDAVNRRISIVVMTRAAEEDAKLTDVPQTMAAGTAENEDKDAIGHDGQEPGSAPTSESATGGVTAAPRFDSKAPGGATSAVEDPMAHVAIVGGGSFAIPGKTPPAPPAPKPGAPQAAKRRTP